MGMFFLNIQGVFIRIQILRHYLVEGEMGWTNKASMGGSFQLVIWQKLTILIYDTIFNISHASISNFRSIGICRVASQCFIISMKSKIVIILLLLIALVNSQSCHYSCATCSGTAYTQCLSCSDTSRSVQTGVKCDSSDQSTLNQLGGLCGSTAYSRANPLGVILILVVIVSATFLKSQHIFFFILSMQTLGLLGLVETALPSGLSLILGSFDYLMLFSIMGQNVKPQNCKLMLRSMYRLNDFLGSNNFKDNAPPILSIVIIATFIMGLVSLYRAFRKQSSTFLSDKTLENILLGLKTFLILAVQQAILIIYAGIRFSSLDGGQIFLIVLYCIALIYLIVDCNIYPLPYFKSTELMNITFLKRVMLPTLVVIPYKFSYSLIVFMFGFNIIEILFLTKAQHSKTKNYLYYILQLACISLLGGFAIADLGLNNTGQANAASIFATLVLVVYLIVFAVQVILGIKNRVRGVKIVNEHKEWDSRAEKSQKSSGIRDDQINQVSNIEIHQQKQIKVVPLDTEVDDLKPVNALQQSYRKQKKFRVN